MFNRKKQNNTKVNCRENKSDNSTNKSVEFKTENYVMPDSFLSEKLFVANIEYVSSIRTLYGPTVKMTDQKYVFEKIEEGSKVRYREVFTGFLADTESGYFDLPYVVNIEPLNEVLSNVSARVPKYSLLLVINEINRKEEKKRK